MKTTWMISRRHRDRVYYLKVFKKEINAAYWTTDYEAAMHFALEANAKKFVREELIDRDLCVSKKEIPPDIVLRFE